LTPPGSGIKVDADAMATLRIIAGPAQGRDIECDRDLLFGREGVDVVIDDAEMSRRHAAIRPGHGGTEVEDLGSRNGTFVDGQRISGTILLTRAATIRMGRSEIALIPGPGEMAPEAGRETPGDPATDATMARGQLSPDLAKTTIRRAPPVPGPSAPPANAGLPGADLPGVGLPGVGLPGADLPGVGLPGVGAPAGAGGGRRRPDRGAGLPPRARVLLPFVVAAIVAVIVYILLH
jgi:FHA domain